MLAPYLLYAAKIENYDFGMFNYISDFVTLVQLMDRVGNVYNTVSLLVHFIFDSNYNRYLPLTE